MKLDGETISCIIAVAGYILRQIDLKRIKKGKEPIFKVFDLVRGIAPKGEK